MLAEVLTADENRDTNDPLGECVGVEGNWLFKRMIFQPLHGFEIIIFVKDEKYFFQLWRNL